MNVKELEELLHISRANIRFYEKEGLLQPNRSDNGYRTYREEDVEQLKKIILLRKLGVSITDIKKCFDEEVSVSDLIHNHLDELNKQLAELKGSIAVCRMIESDARNEKNIDYQKYWEVVKNEEEKGMQFYDIVMDLAQFEGSAFNAMWKNVFFFDMESRVQKRGWAIALVLVVALCLIRGFFFHFVWKNGSFWYGFLYPFLLFFIVSLLTLPMYILNRIYKNREEPHEPEKKEKMRRIPLWGLWKFLGAVGYFLLLVLGIPILLDKYIYPLVFGQTTDYIISGAPFLIFVMFAMYVFYLTLWMYSQNGLFGNLFHSNLPKKVRRKVMLVSAGLYLIASFFYGGWFSCTTLDGILQQHLFWSHRYSWEDVKYYQLSAAYDGVLQYTLVMEDGTKISILGDSSSSNINEKIYPEQEEDFVLQLTKVLTAKKVPLKVESWKKLNRKLTYDYWDRYAEKIRATARMS